MITALLPSGEMKLSCFSAVTPVIGWNQWVKWVAPFSTAQSFIAFATTPAMSGSRCLPSSIVLFSALYVSLGSRSRITRSLNTMLPNSSGIFSAAMPRSSVMLNRSFLRPRRYGDKKAPRKTPQRLCCLHSHYTPSTRTCQPYFCKFF